MPRYKLTIEYDGGGFVGWQRQANGTGVQQVLEEAIAAFSGTAVVTHAAGRTDAGVHALGQVAHFDLERDFDADTVRDALNFHMKPAPVVVRAAEVAENDFHARFSARERRYLYRILNRRPPLALQRGRVWWVAVPLDHVAMAEAAQVLLGEHDFTTFRASMCQARLPVKTVDEIGVARDGEEIRLTVRARSFLHHQVRNFAGSLRLVGEGKWTTADLKDALEARERAAGGPTAPPDGLYLTDVLY